jgi:hypothetical protein
LTTLGNILPAQGIGTGNSLISQGNSLVQPGLMGFMNLMLNPLAVAQNALGTNLLAADNVQALMEKIAAGLNLDPTDPTLLKILEQLKAQQAAAQTTDGIDDIKPTLMSDLSASAATTVQESAEGTETQNIDQLAALLNQMEPGADEFAALNADLLQKLKDLFQKMQPGTEDLTPEQMKQFMQEAQTFLNTQGVADKDVGQYLTTLAMALGIKLPEQTAIQSLGTMPDDALPASPAPLQALKAEADKKREAPVEAPKKAAAPTNLAMINAMARADTGDESSLTTDSKHNMLAFLKNNDMNLNSLTNYMPAGKTLPPQTAQMIAVQMQRNIAAKVDTFTLHLEPMDLGRLEIEMKFNKEGGMKAHMTAERPETLSMLQRDQQQLNRILQQAGIDVDENSLSFDLRQQAQDFDGYGDDSTGRMGRNDRNGFGNTQDNTIQAKIAVEAAGYISQNRVDIRV